MQQALIFSTPQHVRLIFTSSHSNYPCCFLTILSDLTIFPPFFKRRIIRTLISTQIIPSFSAQVLKINDAFLQHGKCMLHYY